MLKPTRQSFETECAIPQRDGMLGVTQWGAVDCLRCLARQEGSEMAERKMKSWSVMIPWFATVTVNVEAKTKKAAIKKALEEADDSLCYRCGQHVNLDGGPDYDESPEVVEGSS